MATKENAVEGTSKKTNGTQITIKNSTNIRFEEGEEFENSILWDAYRQAFEMTRDIVRAHEEWYSAETLKSTGTVKRNLEQIYNIISFVGKNGAGKTSTMLSYMEFLKDYYRKVNNQKETKPESMYDRDMKIMFTGLEYIDASMLNEQEDVLGSILAKMLGKWEEEEKKSGLGAGIIREDDYAFKKRQLHMQFSRVYECMRVLNSKNSLMDEDNDMFMDTLQKLSMTRNLKKSFQELVEGYLDIMEYKEGGSDVTKKNHFLVVSIDDLDINISNGYRLFEDIRKYLMIPNVIVLMTVKKEQLAKICQEYYFREFRESGKYRESTKRYVEDMVKEYMNKLMPEHRQVTLDSGKNWKYFGEQKITLVVGEKSEVQKEGTIKEIILRDLYDKLGMLFDPAGGCADILTPDTIRELSNWSIEIEKISEADGREAYSWFWKQEFPWLCLKYLTDEENVELSQIDENDIHTNLIDIRNMLMGRGIKLSGLKEENSVMHNAEKLNRLGTIYEMMNILQMVHSKERLFIRIIQIYITARLTNAIKIQSEKNTILRMYYGYSIWETWERKMFAPIQANNKTSRFGLISFRKNSGLQLILSGDFGKHGTEKFEASYVKRLLDDNKSVLEDFQHVLLFYGSLKPYDLRKEDHQMWSMDRKEDGAIISLKEDWGGVFSISGFVLNMLEGANVVEEFMTALKSGILGMTKADLSAKGRADLHRKIEQLKVFRKAEELMPLNNVEFLVNLGKKVQEQLGDEVLDESGTLFGKYFGIIKEELKKLDEMYHTKYGEKFEEFSLVKKVEDKSGSFNKMLFKNIEKLVGNHGEMQEKVEDWVE